MGPGFESQRDHRVTVKPLDYQGVLFFKVVKLTKKTDQVKKLGARHKFLRIKKGKIQYY